MDLRRVLESPVVYQLFQQSGGFFNARLKAIARHLDVPETGVIVDVGCGPGYLRRHLPSTCRYIGFDTDQDYIDFARRHHAQNAEYHCQPFDAGAVAQVRPVDIVMMNGLLHHLTDAEAQTVVTDAYNALKPGGRIFTLDGCYTPGQTAFKRRLLDLDRGQYVRTRDEYAALFAGEFGPVRSVVEEDLSWVPYTWISHIATKAA